MGLIAQINKWDNHSCCSFMLIKALAKSNSNNLFAIAFKSEKERQLLLLL